MRFKIECDVPDDIVKFGCSQCPFMVEEFDENVEDYRCFCIGEGCMSFYLDYDGKLDENGAPLRVPSWCPRVEVKNTDPKFRAEKEEILKNLKRYVDVGSTVAVGTNLFYHIYSWEDILDIIMNNQPFEMNTGEIVERLIKLMED